MLIAGGFRDLDRACDAALRVAQTKGMAALSVRAIAHEMQVTVPALTHRWDNKARLWGLMVHEIGDRWLAALGRSIRDRGLAGFVPVGEEEVLDVRLWLGFSDLARDDEALSPRVADVLDRERGRLRLAASDELGVWLDDLTLDVLRATYAGLRDRVCSVRDPLPQDRATAAWSAVLDALVPARTQPGVGQRG